MHRMQAQLIDYVVENSEPSVTSRLQERYELTTDSQGLTGAWLPPGAEISVLCHAPPKDDQSIPSSIMDPLRHLTISHDLHFVGFELQQMSCVRVHLSEFGNGLPIKGARVRFVMSQDETGNLVDIVLKVLETSEEGRTDWVYSRTGTLVRAELEKLPWKVSGKRSRFVRYLSWEGSTYLAALGHLRHSALFTACSTWVWMLWSE